MMQLIEEAEEISYTITQEGSPCLGADDLVPNIEEEREKALTKRRLVYSNKDYSGKDSC